MRQHDIPGLVCGLVWQGRPYFLERGTTARSGGAATSRDTMFELGSISKCLTSTLAALAHAQGRLHLSQPVGEIVRSLADSPIGRATLVHLATYTAGGLPLQFPPEITSTQEALAYLAAFSPNAPPGSIRNYSNPSIGLLGHATALCLGGDFADLSERHLFAAMGLGSTFIRVPAAHMHRYAWGHDHSQRQVRVNPGPFAEQAYGVKSTASDMLVFLQAHFDATRRLSEPVHQAISETTAPRYRVGPMLQGMGWEMYPWPASMQELHEGNGARTIFETLMVQPLEDQPLPTGNPAQDPGGAAATPARRALLGRGNPMLLNKTGSTSGFGAYVAVVPHMQIALVMLTNRNFPIGARVTAARQVLEGIGALH